MSEKPRLIYGASVRRKRYFVRFLRALFLTVVVAGAYIALDEASRRALADPLLLNIGQLVAVVLAGMLAVRALYNLVMALVRRSETVRIYDKGIVWTKAGVQHKYAWHQLETYREGARGLYFARWPVLQWGANVFTMTDGVQFRYNHRFGDTRTGTQAARRYADYVTGVRMGRALRAQRPVQLHPRLTIYPTGIESGKHEIHWSEVDVRMQGNRLEIRRLDTKGRFKTVGRYPRHKVDNVGGLIEVASATIANYQPERFRQAATAASHGQLRARV